MPKNIALRYKDVNVGERYAIVTKNNGNNFTVELLDGTIKQVSVQGKLCRGPKKTKILPNDYVLIEPIDNPLTGKWIIVHKYTKKNITQLKKEGYIVEETKNNEQNNFFENNTNNEQFIDDI